MIAKLYISAWLNQTIWLDRTPYFWVGGWVHMWAFLSKLLPLITTAESQMNHAGLTNDMDLVVKESSRLF